MPLEARVERNENVYREVNERIRSLEESFVERDAGSPPSFVCECMTTGCSTMIEMSLDEYRLARAKPNRFLVAVGHADPSSERVVVHTDRFELVEKLDEPPIVD